MELSSQQWDRLINFVRIKEPHELDGMPLVNEYQCAASLATGLSAKTLDLNTINKARAMARKTPIKYPNRA